MIESELDESSNLNLGKQIIETNPTEMNETMDLKLELDNDNELRASELGLTQNSFSGKTTGGISA